MKLIRALKLHQCKKCNADIWLNDFYYPQRRKKALCFKCGSKPKRKSFMARLLCKISN